jgi:hypothetical protein
MPATHIDSGRRDVDDENMLLAAYGNPSSSSCRLASRADIPQSTVWCVLHENQMHPYHLQPVQGLQPGDSKSRLQICRYILHKTMD